MCAIIFFDKVLFYLSIFSKIEGVFLQKMIFELKMVFCSRVYLLLKAVFSFTTNNYKF